MTGVKTLLCVLLALGLPAQACRLTPLALQGSDAVLGALSIRIEEPEDAAQPRLWAGEIVVTRPDGRCTTPEEVGNITAPIMVGNGRLLFVPTVSGSMSRLFLIDPASCRVVWASDPFLGPPRLTAGQATLGTVNPRRLALNAECLPNGR